MYHARWSLSIWTRTARLRAHARRAGDTRTRTAWNAWHALTALRHLRLRLHRQLLDVLHHVHANLARGIAALHELLMHLQMLRIVVGRMNRHFEPMEQHVVLNLRVLRKLATRVFENLRRETRPESVLYQQRDDRLQVERVRCVLLRRDTPDDVHPGNLLLHLLRITRRFDTVPAKLIAVVHLNRLYLLHVSTHTHLTKLTNSQWLIAKLVIKLSEEPQHRRKDTFLQNGNGISRGEDVNLLLLRDLGLIALLLLPRGLRHDGRRNAQRLENLGATRVDHLECRLPQFRKLGELRVVRARLP